MAKERNQNLRPNDQVTLRLYAFNGAQAADVAAVQQVAIYKLASVPATADNPDGKSLVQTIAGTSVVQDAQGQYSITTTLSDPLFTVGRYQDEWTLLFENSLPPATTAMNFQIVPNAWFVDSSPLIYDFSFDFAPNKIVSGSKRYIQIFVTPNVPRGSDKQRYYESLAVGGNLYISLQQKCGNCMPAEEDLRLVIDSDLVTTRDGVFGFYMLDTTDLDCGIYDVWFELDIGTNVYISDKQPLQIFD